MERESTIEVQNDVDIETEKAIGIIYAYDDKPPLMQSIVAAVQHFLAIFVGIITPPIIVGRALKLPLGMNAYLISMALFVSGVATFIQARRIGPIGSGLLSIQGTSFAFLSTIMAIGLAVTGAGGTPQEAIATICGVCLCGCFIEMVLSRFLPQMKRVFPPLVSGIVVTLIGLSLVRVGITDFGGGFAAMHNHTFGSFQNLALATLVLIIIVAFNASQKPIVRMSSVAAGIVVGYIVAFFMGRIDFGKLGEISIFSVPVPMKYGFKFSLSGFLSVALLYVITTIESIGDLTATALLSGHPIKGKKYMRALQGGIMADGFNSGLAALFNTFPNTTFSQNNGIIQLTGIGSRYVGYFIAGMLVLVGLFPVIGGIFSLTPPSVIGGATVDLFGTVAAAGIKIIASEAINKRSMLIMAASFGTGLGVSFVPNILSYMPPLMKSILSSGITTGGLTAIILNLLIPYQERIPEEIQELPTEPTAVNPTQAG